MLPAPRIVCGTPEPRRGEPWIRAFEEGAACLWLWAWPELLGWQMSIEWLFSPVVGNRVWPGDLWGVDSRGELLIVEAKTCRPGARPDPFEDFVGKGRALANGTSTAVRADSLEGRWAKLLERERQFIRRYCDALRAASPLDGRYPGVMPYSRHRAQIQRWRHVYLERIVPKLDGREYVRRVRGFLRTRCRKDNPPPHFIGLLAVLEGDSTVPSAKGRCHWTALKRVAGADHVHLVAVQAQEGAGVVEIVSRPIVW
jgi:hypothetical protein